MRVDFHVHVTPPDIIANWEKYALRDEYFSLLSNGKSNKFATAEDVVAVLEREDSHFDMAVVFGFGFKDLGLCRYVNDYVIEKVKQYPQRLAGFCVVPDCKEAAEEINRCYSAGLKGVGELFSFEQGLEDVSEACRQLDIPLLLHANEPVGHSYPGKTDVSLKQLESFITNNQSLKIVLAHWGGGLFLYEAMGEIKEKCRNVYYDTAATPFLYDERIYSAAKALALCEKILFGSDFPLLPHSRYLAGLDKSTLFPEEKALILGGNASKLLKLNEIT